MTVFVIRDPAGVELRRSEDFDRAFAFRAGWNCAHAMDCPRVVAEVFEVTPDGERLVDRVQMLADALGVDRKRFDS